MRFVTRMAPIVVVIASFAACSIKTNDGVTPAANGGTSDGGATGDGSANTNVSEASTDGGQDLGECVRYTPAEIAGTKAGTFASADDLVKIALPETDVGGGLLKVTYVADSQPVVGSLWLAEGDKKDTPRVETTAIGVTGSAPASGVVYLRLAGKKRYELGVKPFYFAEGGKNGYSVTYAYEPQIDCYESNDTVAAAKRIPVNTTITASLHSGIDMDDTSSVANHDWYSFELAAEKVVRLKAVLPGKDGADGKNATKFAVYAADGETAARCAGSERMETDPVAATENVETCEGTLPAGKYFVELSFFSAAFSSTAKDVAPHKSWITPYTFVVDAK